MSQMYKIKYKVFILGSCMCVQQDQAKDRPSILDVISFLSNDYIQLAQPK